MVAAAMTTPESAPPTTPAAAAAPPDVAPVRPDEQLDVAIVSAYLRGRLPGSDEPLEILQFPGGHANLTYLLRYGDSADAVEYVLRRPPLGPVAPKSHDMVREYRALAALGPHFPPAPRVYHLCEDPGVIGAPFFVMERRRGLVIRRTMPVEIPDDADVRRRIGEAAVDTLADLHAVPVAGTPLAAIGRPARRSVGAEGRPIGEEEIRPLVEHQVQGAGLQAERGV